MKLVAENPEEDQILKEMLEKLNQDKAVHVYGESFGESFAKNTLADSLLKDLKENKGIFQWSASQRMWFQHVCDDFVKAEKYRELASDFKHLIGIYDLIFKEERQAFEKAREDYSLFLMLQKKIQDRYIHTYKALDYFVRNDAVIGRESEIKRLDFYYDEKMAGYVMELNSIKIPVAFENKKLKEDAIVYAWCDSECAYQFEFFKYDLVSRDCVSRQEREELQPENSEIDRKGSVTNIKAVDLVH